MSNLKALQIIMPSGIPSGLKIIEISNWNGKCYIIPRQSLNELDENSFLNNPGLYILFGKDESSNEQLAYIGESENFYKRITSHYSTKEFWDEAAVFTGELNKAHVKYLEYRVVSLAKQAKRMKIQNSVAPPENRLSEYDKLNVEDYFKNIQFILEAMNYEIFKTIEQSVPNDDLYHLKGKGFDATAKRLDNGGMIVLAGSLASVQESNSFGGWAKAAREQFLQDGTLKPEDEQSYRFTKDAVFRRPSAAAATVASRSINGWTAWKDSSGNTLDQNIRQH